MKNKNEKKLEARRDMLKMLNKMEDKKVKDLAQSIEDISFFLTRKIDTAKTK